MSIPNSPDEACIRLASRLMQFESVTPHSAGCLEYIAEFLEGLGFETELLAFGPDNILNLYARRKGQGPKFCFAGHVDVVPPGDIAQWKYRPFEPAIEGDKLYGRGAVDMKAAIAAMMVAAREVLPKAPEADITFLLTADEEGIAEHGTKPLVSWMMDRGIELDFCIIGEPTYIKTFGDVIQIGRRGSANFLLEVYGQQGHVAYGNFVNPNLLATSLVKKLSGVALDSGTEFFDPSKLNVTSIDTGNVVTNVVPGKTEVRFNIRYNDLHDPTRLENLLSKMIEEEVGSNYKLTLLANPPSPYLSHAETDNIKLFAHVVKDVVGVLPTYTTYGGASDGRFIRNLCPVIEFGLATDAAHQVNEHLFIQDLHKLYRVYEKFLLKYFDVGCADVAEWQTHQT